MHGSTCTDLIQSGGSDIKSLASTLSSLQNSMAVMQAEICDLRGRIDPAAGAFGVITIKAIKALVCLRFGFTEKELMSCARRGARAHARHIATHLCCRLTKHSMGTIADNLGYRDHSTVCHARDAIADRRLHNAGFDEMLTRMECELRLQTKKTVPTKR